MGARNRLRIGLSYWPARLQRLAESIPGLLKSLKIPSHFEVRFILLTVMGLIYWRSKYPDTVTLM